MEPTIGAYSVRLVTREVYGFWPTVDKHCEQRPPLFGHFGRHSLGTMICGSPRTVAKFIASYAELENSPLGNKKI